MYRTPIREINLPRNRHRMARLTYSIAKLHRAKAIHLKKRLPIAECTTIQQADIRSAILVELYLVPVLLC